MIAGYLIFLLFLFSFFFLGSIFSIFLQFLHANFYIVEVELLKIGIFSFLFEKSFHELSLEVFLINWIRRPLSP